jgi:hypothetical protein
MHSFAKKLMLALALCGAITPMAHAEQSMVGGLGWSVMLFSMATVFVARAFEELGYKKACYFVEAGVAGTMGGLVGGLWATEREKAAAKKPSL